jgi:DNA-binding HxlR family transcriptional regulator
MKQTATPKISPMAEPTTKPALAEALERVGDRWSLLIVNSLRGGPRRFNDLAGDVAGISPNILSARLKQLESHGIVVARPYSDKPVRVSYELSAAGKELAGALRMLAHWAGATAGEAPTHRACGTPLDVRWYCPTCARTVADPEDPETRLL